MVVITFGALPANAAISDKCSPTASAQNGFKVIPNHAKTFYIDTGQGQKVDAGYVSYTVENTNPTDKANLWVGISNFTGGAP